MNELTGQRDKASNIMRMISRNLNIHRECEGRYCRQTQQAEPRRCGFTIVELIVAIGVTIILILAVAKIFATTRTTISTGTAISETSATARTVQNLMRSDIDYMIRSGTGFLVIRNERIGPDAVTSTNHRRGIYFDKDDENNGVNMGTRRLDQLVFFSNGDFPTYQFRDPSFGQSNIIAKNDTAPTARVWYGHMLRAPDPGSIDGIKNGTGLNGYSAKFGDDSTGQNVDMANKYVQDWILGREAAPLMTRAMAGIDNPADPSYQELNFAPSFIELFNEFDGPPPGYWTSSKYFDPPLYPFTDVRRRLSPGYVDIIDMTMSGVAKAVTEYGTQYNRATGVMDPYQDPMQTVLGFGGTSWTVDKGISGPPSGYVTNINDQNQLSGICEPWVEDQRLRMMYSTGRIRGETAVPSPDRFHQMLTHATLAVGCSDFQVAWSTGKISYPGGDLVWYDIDNPANPYAFHKNMTNRQVLFQTPDDAREWYLPEVLPPSSGINDPGFTTIPGGGRGEKQSGDLYYAVFGMFIPMEGDSTRANAWPWPKLLRVRVTLHDDLNRIPGGRTYEFIFKLPSSNDSISGS